MTRRTALLALAVALVGCPKRTESTSTSDAGTTAATTSAAPSPKAGSAVGASATPGTTKTAGNASAWSLTYTITPGSLYIPSSKDWSSTKFKNDDAKYLGDGALSFAVDASGRVSGTSEGGPLGDALLDGHAEGGALTATVRRKTPSDLGLTGTLTAKIDGDKLEGTMTLADTNAAVVREAKVTGTRGK